VSLCPECRTRELFLLNQARDESLILRSLEEHQLEIAYAEPERDADNSDGSSGGAGDLHEPSDGHS
jgi:hypothetical protein